MTDVHRCELCGEPMPAGEEMFRQHGYSGPCPKPPLPRSNRRTGETAQAHAKRALEAAKHALRSYQYGNAATDLAKHVADECEDALLHLAETTGEGS